MGLSRKQIAMLAVLVFGTFVTVLNQTVVAPALPSVMVEMNVDAATAQWLTTGFTLVNAIMIPITAFLTDRFTTRRLFLISMVIFTAGSALAGWGPSFFVLLLGRLVQAAGAGILMPLVMTVLMWTFPLEKRGTAMGLFGIVIAFGPAIGPTAAGIIIDRYTWHDMFYIIAVLSALVVVIAAFVLQKGGSTKKDVTLDVPSVVLSSVGFGGLLYGLSTIGSYGVSVGAAVGTLAGAVALVLFFRRQLSMEHPMLEVRVLANRKFLVATVIGMLVQGALLAAGILVPIYLQSLMGEIARMDARISLSSQITEAGYPDLELSDIYGKKVRLSSLAGKVVLLDFWSAELGNSNTLNAELKEVYKKYADAPVAFEVYQVAIDTSKPLWISAVQEQQLPWVSVSDLRGRASSSLGLYNVQKLPANFLIDKEGNIVGKDIYGKSPEQKPDELTR